MKVRIIYDAQGIISVTANDNSVTYTMQSVLVEEPATALAMLASTGIDTSNFGEFITVDQVPAG